MIWLAYLALGAIAGLMAGLFGVGGGAIMVPVLALLFARLDLPNAHLMHLALGTSMAAIVFTSLASLRAHAAREAVLWPAVRGMAPGIVLGTFLGAMLAGQLPTRPLAWFFAAFMSYVALQLLFDLKPHPARPLPGKVGLGAVGLGIGAVSALAAIGGGTMSVPFLTWCNVPLRVAIGTSAAIGFPIALSGSLGYFVAGQGATSLPAGSFGFIYLPALGLLVLASMLTAPIGARLAHRLPVRVLKKLFAVLILTLLAEMLHGLP